MTTRRISLAHRRARMGLRHLLVPQRRVCDAISVVRALGALHATDPATVYLTIAARLDGSDAVNAIRLTDTAVLTDRSVARHHAMRRTVWLMQPHIIRAAHASCTIALAQREWALFAKMLADNGVADPATWMRNSRNDAVSAVQLQGTATARKVAAAAPHLNVPLQLAVGKSYAGIQGAHTRLMQNLGFDGELVRTRSTGSWVSGEYEWAVATSWIAGGIVDPATTPRAGAATIAIEYLTAFGPATTADLQWWAGWSVAMTKTALADIGAVPVTTEIDAAGTTAAAWVLPDDDLSDTESSEWATILPSLDPTVMGWKQRTWYTGAHGGFGHTVFDRNGNAGNTIMANGSVVGTWAHRPDHSVATQLFEPLNKKLRSQIDDSIDQYRSMVGPTVVRPRYPAPLAASLLAK